MISIGVLEGRDAVIMFAVAFTITITLLILICLELKLIRK